jgi:hypothetical protein
MTNTKYLLINGRTNKIVGNFNNLQRARNRLDKLDNEYGGYIHRIRENEFYRE